MMKLFIGLNARVFLCAIILASVTASRASSPDEKHRQYWEETCRAGQINSCHSLGLLLYDGEPQDKARARELFVQSCRASEAGVKSSCRLLQFFFGDGGGGPQARTLYEEACKDGDAFGCSILGTMFRKGEGGPQDKAHARTLYEKACRGGDAIGCNNLGFMYEAGDGGPQDKVLAQTFFEQACKLGFNGDCTPLESMDAQAESEADPEWKAKFRCRIDFLDDDPVNKPTYCQDRSGGEREMHWLHPCYGVQGWCDAGD